MHASLSERGVSYFMAGVKSTFYPLAIMRYLAAWRKSNDESFSGMVQPLRGAADKIMVLSPSEVIPGERIWLASTKKG
jgi:hypothetical protein